MKAKVAVAVLIASGIALGGCETTQPRTGGVAGAMFFGHVGPTMEESDKQRAIQAVSSGQDATWRSGNGNSYTVKNVRTFDSGGQTCRDYSIMGNIGGREQATQGTACRTASGSWASGA